MGDGETGDIWETGDTGDTGEKGDTRDTGLIGTTVLRLEIKPKIQLKVLRYVLKSFEKVLITGFTGLIELAGTRTRL